VVLESKWHNGLHASISTSGLKYICVHLINQILDFHITSHPLYRHYSIIIALITINLYIRPREKESNKVWITQNKG